MQSKAQQHRFSCWHAQKVLFRIYKRHAQWNIWNSLQVSVSTGELLSFSGQKKRFLKKNYYYYFNSHLENLSLWKPPAPAVYTLQGRKCGRLTIYPNTWPDIASPDICAYAQYIYRERQRQREKERAGERRRETKRAGDGDRKESRLSSQQGHTDPCQFVIIVWKGLFCSLVSGLLNRRERPVIILGFRVQFASYYRSSEKLNMSLGKAKDALRRKATLERFFLDVVSSSLPFSLPLPPPLCVSPSRWETGLSYFPWSLFCEFFRLFRLRHPRS